MENPPAAPEPSAETAVSVEPAGFWVRAGAYLVDGVILAVAGIGVGMVARGLGVLVGPVYKTIFVSQGGQTPGKMAAGLRVIRADGEPVSLGRALARTAAEYVSMVTLGLGYLAAAFGEKRALHDYIAGTRVVYVDGVSRGRRVAFTVLGVLGGLLPILAIVAGFYFGVGGFGRFRDLTSRSKEGATKGNLGSLRSGASIYYGDAEGAYPATLEELVPKYLQSIPAVKIKDHAETNAWTAYGDEVCVASGQYSGSIDPAKVRDTGGWGYVVDPQSKCWGAIFVDCSHKDAKDRAWTEY